MASVVSWFVSGLGLKLPQPPVSEETEVTFTASFFISLILSFCPELFLLFQEQIFSNKKSYCPSIHRVKMKFYRRVSRDFKYILQLSCS